jgi:hypothetical protein
MKQKQGKFKGKERKCSSNFPNLKIIPSISKSAKNAFFCSPNGR